MGGVNKVVYMTFIGPVPAVEGCFHFCKSVGYQSKPKMKRRVLINECK